MWAKCKANHFVSWRFDSWRRREQQGHQHRHLFTTGTQVVSMNELGTRYIVCLSEVSMVR